MKRYIVRLDAKGDHGKEGAYFTRQVTRNSRTTEIARKLGEALFEKYLPVRA